jgi:hypothetical protein
MKVGSLVVPSGVLERLPGGRTYGRRFLTGDDQPEAIVAVLIAFATTASREIGQLSIVDVARGSVENVEQQSMAD